MADTSESSSSSSSSSSPHLNPPAANVKPVIVRVKRKPSQSPLEAFWLEINERPLKKQRPLLDLAKLSISDSTGKEELKSKKVFVQHVETVNSSKATVDVLQSFVPNSADVSKFKTKIEERRLTFKQENKQEQLLSRARENHEVLAKNARFEQIWKKRKGNKDAMHDDSFHELCSLYDVVRVDEVEGETFKVAEPDDTSLTLEDSTILYNYLPLLRDYLPSVAAEIQSDVQAYFSEQASTDDYVYDLYAVQDELTTLNEDALNAYPLVQVAAEDDFYDGPDESEYDSQDSNAEDNPLNDYPDEETSEEDEEDKSRTSLDESDEVESRSSSDHHEEHQNRKYLKNHSEDEYGLYEEEGEDMLGVEDGDDDDDDDDDDGKSEDDWRWKHR